MASFGCAIALGAGVLLASGLVISLAGAVMDTPEATAPDEVEGIDPTLLQAYVQGPQFLEAPEFEQCTGLRWQVLAGIGSVESDHGATSTIHPDGTTDPPSVGPTLDGSGVGDNLTPHYDTDGGKWDGDDVYDAAVGVTQHLPANWDRYGVNARGGTEADPHNVFDSVASTAVELCQSAQGAPVDFTDRGDLENALYRYNPAWWYVEDVLAEVDRYDTLHPGTGTSVAGPVSPEGITAAEWALQQVGKPYVWGGTGPDGFDCSGLTQQAWAAAGVSIPRVTTDQYTAGDRVSLDELAPGDLLFYDTRPYAPGDPPTHVTMYVGDGQMINAPSTGQDVRVEAVDGTFYAPRFMGAVRPSP
ncbi:C40 family peptidase [Nocardiopsis sp. NPDC006938]|uniref:C40 family peptidase n=1 Tax=Nocardiopsis sp. NPDC006938 TaxID=3364337 RepID=UPI00368607EA